MLEIWKSMVPVNAENVKKERKSLRGAKRDIFDAAYGIRNNSCWVKENIAPEFQDVADKYAANIDAWKNRNLPKMMEIAGEDLKIWNKYLCFCLQLEAQKKKSPESLKPLGYMWMDRYIYTAMVERAQRELKEKKMMFDYCNRNIVKERLLSNKR